MCYLYVNVYTTALNAKSVLRIPSVDNHMLIGFSLMGSSRVGELNQNVNCLVPST